ncbi:NAD(P)/FAD-dependent oxidoreductase [Gryllotalpicola sp.]|uniref:dihydrolipoyl dehydrogenase family protein n=1 Tax=Gryllotalpicola sp. TaxID=1932787 RepID=UPI002609BED7|nr:NAD(P)/FAD-dependent oxidoreductase [Gryllotalpicola sp.]
MDLYDLIVIGAGPVGENVADYAAKRGLSVAIVEEELVGGECSYWACMPSKALLRSGHALAAAQRVGGAAQVVGSRVDAAAVLERRTSFAANWDDASQVDWLGSAGIDLIRGHGRLVGVRAVEVGGTRYRARAAVAVATGSVPVLPDIPGLADAQPWSTREATSAKSIPASLAVIGGGVAAVELATAYARLGASVTLLARSGLLSGQEPFAGEAVAGALRALGVDVRLGVQPVRVDRSGPDGPVALELPDGPAVVASEVLVATGRTARTADLGLDAVGLTANAPLDVDDTMLVRGTDWLYGVGDVNHRALLTHQGKYQARAAGEAIAARYLGTAVRDAPWGAHVATADHAAVPQVIFTDPEVARVGLTEAEARSAGFEVRAVEYDLGWVAGASLQADGYQGRAKMVVDERRKVVVGVTFVGQDVAELVHAATIAVVGEVTLERLWHAVPAYPTMSEIWLRLLEAYGRPAV